MADSKPSWRGDGRARRGNAGARSRWPRLIAVGALGIALAGASVAIFASLGAKKPPTFLALANPRSGRPTAAADREWLGRIAPKGASPGVVADLKELETRLKTLKADAPLILYVSAPTRDQGGNLVLLGGEPTRLADVLAALRRSKPAVKLLLLDLYPPTAEDAASGLPAEDPWPAVAALLASSKVPGLRVLTSAGPGQSPQDSEVWARSTFAHYVGLGLVEGEADGRGEASGEADGVVTAGELAAYVAARVDDWAQVHRESRQVPALIAPAGAADPRLADVAIKPRAKVSAASKAVEAPKDGPPPKVETPKYPAALLAGWERRDRWRASRLYEVAPRPYRRLEVALLEAERAWRLGAAPGSFAGPLETALDRSRTDEAQWVPPDRSPPDRSLAAAARRGLAVDPGLVEGVGNLARQVAEKPPKELADAWAKLATPFEGDEPAKSFAVAWAVIAAARDADRRMPPPGVRFPRLAGWLAAGHSDPRFAETAALRSLASLAGPGVDDPTLRRALEAACLGEELDASPRTFARFPAEARRAADRRHMAEVLLRSRGYAPEGAAALAAEEAQKAAADLRNRGKLLESAEALAARAMATLPGAAPYADALGGDALADWRAAAGSIGGLLKAVEDGDRPEVEALTERLGPPLARFEPYFFKMRGDDDKRVADAIRAAEDPAGRGGRGYVALDAFLASTIPAAGDRVKLASAARALARRLDEAHRGHPFAEPAPPAEAVPAAENDRAKLARLYLEAAGGVAPEVATPSTYRAAWTALLSAAEAPARRDRLSRLAPTWLAGDAIDARDRSPARQARVDGAAALYGWLADRVAFEAEDLDGDPFARKSADAYRQAALAYRDADAPAWPPTLKVEVDGPLDLSRSATAAATLRFEAAGPGPRPRIKSLGLLAPDDPRLKVELIGAEIANLDLSARPSLRVSWSPEALAKEARRPRPAGVLVQVAWNDRVYSRKVPIVGLPTGEEPILLLAAAGTEPVPLPKNLRLRPLADRQPLAIAVRNPGPSEIKVVLEVAGAGLSLRSPTLTLGPGATLPFKPDPATKAGEPVDLDGPIVVRVLDEAGKAELARAEVAVGVLDPARYVRVVPGTAQYYPKSPEDRAVNRLELKVQGLDGGQPAGGPPSRVALNLAGAIDPSSPPKDQSPAALLDPASLEPAPLHASGFAGRPAAGGEGVFYLDVDGVPRALKFRVNLSAAGPARRPAVEDLAPALLPLVVAKYVDAAAPKAAEVLARVDNAPPGSRLSLSMATAPKAGGGAAVVLQSASYAPARRERVRWGVDPTLGMFLLAEVADRSWPLVLGGDRGPREVRAVLTMPGRPDLVATARIILDDQPPTVDRLSLPATVPHGSMALRASVRATSETDIASASFYLGNAPAQGQKPTEKQYPATLDRATGLWVATIPLKGEERGRLEVTARAINGIGRDAYAEAAVTVSPPEPAGGKPAKPGRITGQVVLGTLSQPDMEVVLRDPKGVEVARTKTDADGNFAFEKLAPGAYKVESQKTFPIRTGKADATVVEDKAAAVKVDLAG